jgi:MoxR-like ATPase
MTEPQSRLSQLREQLGRVILGKPEAIDQVIVALLSGCHLLMEDVPGVGKTTLAKALARSFDGDFKRVQFTPDLLPTDILGSSVFNPKDSSFSFKAGPIFTHVLLADEINRASPRTQSALLEAMSEGQVSIDGETRELAAPFMVIATQNPVEFHGTYPLPEAQLDRFGLRVSLGYPKKDDEVEMLYAQAETHPLKSLTAALDGASVLGLQKAVRKVAVERRLARYIVDLAEGTRRHQSVQLPCSPRGTLALFRAAQARAFLEGRDYAIPEDVKAEAVPVLAHRLGLETKARYAGVSKESVVRAVMDSVAVPV